MSDTEGGGFDLGALLQSAQQMQAQLADAQAKAAEVEVVGRAGGGAVEVTTTGTGEFRRVRIAPEAVDPAEVGELEDLVLAALHDAAAQVAALQQGAMGGLDLGSLGGLLGGAER
ncbi:MAG: YbaB/EbfC family nucleoid-associated protein [Acidimicrobiales bacterium]